MSFAERHNKKGKFTFQAPDDFEYFKLEKLYDPEEPHKVHRLRALFVTNKGKYGPSAVAVTDDCYANLPAHMIDEVEEIVNSDEDVADINAGAVGFEIYTYESVEGTAKKPVKNTRYSVKWVDLDPNEDLPF